MSRLTRLLHNAQEHEKEMDLHRARFKRVKNAKRGRAVIAFNLFQTPKDIADRMAGLLPRLPPGGCILEPSAGLGRLYSAVRRSGLYNKITLIENNFKCALELYELSRDDNALLLQRDFLTYQGSFDAVIMNPPFKMGTDIKHIRHALTCLKPGGVLVALCYDGAKQNKHLKPIANTWEVLPYNSFKESGTNASVVLLTIKKEV